MLFANYMVVRCHKWHATLASDMLGIVHYKVQNWQVLGHRFVLLQQHLPSINKFLISLEVGKCEGLNEEHSLPSRWESNSFQVILKWVWPLTNQNKLLFIQMQTLPLNMHPKWIFYFLFFWYCMQTIKGKTSGGGVALPMKVIWNGWNRTHLECINHKFAY